MVFHWSLKECKSPQIFRTLIILDDLKKCCNLDGLVLQSLHQSFGDLPSTLITIGINVTFMFHRFCSSLGMSKYLSLFQPSFSFTLWSAGKPKFHYSAGSLISLLVVWLRLGDPLVSQNPQEFLSPPIPTPVIWWLYRAHQFQLISTSPLCSIDFSFP